MFKNAEEFATEGPQADPAEINLSILRQLEIMTMLLQGNTVSGPDVGTALDDFGAAFDSVKVEETVVVGDIDTEATLVDDAAPTAADLPPDDEVGRTELEDAVYAYLTSQHALHPGELIELEILNTHLVALGLQPIAQGGLDYLIDQYAQTDGGAAHKSDDPEADDPNHVAPDPQNDDPETATDEDGPDMPFSGSNEPDEPDEAEPGEEAAAAPTNSSGGASGPATAGPAALSSGAPRAS